MKVLIINGGPKKNGATAEISKIISDQLAKNNRVKNICLGDKKINYCLGCKSCHINGACCQEDDVTYIVQSIFSSDAVLIVVPSYWAEVPGQMKVFIDRCTPYSNTNPMKKNILHETKGYTIVLRTGSNPAECKDIIKSINHYYGHMGIEEKASSYFCGINDKKDIERQQDDIVSLCNEWFCKYE